MLTSTGCAMPRSTSSVSGALASSASTRRESASITRKRRGGTGSGAACFGRGLGSGRARRRSGSEAGCLSTFSSGTICAPVPFVSVSRTQTFAIRTTFAGAGQRWAWRGSRPFSRCSSASSSPPRADGDPIEMVLHTPGGIVLAASQIAAALADHDGHMTAIVPHYAMSGGTLIALAPNEIVVDAHSALGPVDPQLGQYPAASIISAAARPGDHDDQTLVLADCRAQGARSGRVLHAQPARAAAAARARPRARPPALDWHLDPPTTTRSCRASFRRSEAVADAV